MFHGISNPQWTLELPRPVHCPVMYEVKTALESLTAREEAEGGDNPVREGRGVPGDQHEV